MLIRHILVAFSIAAVTTNAQAATLTNINGTVMVNRGDGFIEVSGTTIVNQGDRVLVRGRGRARIDYGDDCLAEIRANQSAMVLPPKNCEKTPLYSASTDSSGSLKDLPPLYAADEVIDQHVHFIGGVIIVAGATAIAIHNNDGNPASP